MSHSKQILDSWEANAGNWITTIEKEEIESRKVVTNDAIVNTVLKYAPKKSFGSGLWRGLVKQNIEKKRNRSLGD